MQKRIFAILALILFIAGIAVFIASLIAGTNDYTFYAVIFCAPGALMVFLNHMAQKRAHIQTMQEEREDCHEELN